MTTEIKSIRKRDSMGPNSVIIQKTAPGTRMSYGPGTTVRRNVTMSQSFGGPMHRPMGEVGKVSKESVETVMATRGKEKREMGDLNGKLANYIDKVKYMEACNKAMAEEIERLRKMKGYTQQRVRDEYEDELKEARETIAQLSKELAPLQAKILALEDKCESKDETINALNKQKDDLQNQINKLNQAIGDLEGELHTLRYQMEALGKENEMLKSDLARAKDDNDRVRADFEAAVARQITAENERDALDEELQFVRDTTDAEIEELRQLLANFKSMTPDIQKMWKSEFKDCIAAIQKEYGDQLDRISAEQQRRYEERITSMENAYRRDNTDSSVVKQQNKTLKSQVGDSKNKMADLERENARLRAELDALRSKYDEECRECEDEKAELREAIARLEEEMSTVMGDLDRMRGENMDLELEIACYRKLLEGEEHRNKDDPSMKRLIEDQNRVQSEGGAALASMIAGGRGGASSSQTSTMSESTGLVRVSRSSKCAISIAEIAQDGTSVRLENGSASKDFDLSNWNLTRKHPKGQSSFKFPSNYKLGPRKSVRVFAHSFEENAGSDDLVASKASCKTWGVGSGEYRLTDDSGSDKATSKIDFQS